MNCAISKKIMLFPKKVTVTLQTRNTNGSSQDFNFSISQFKMSYRGTYITLMCVGVCVCVPTSQVQYIVMHT